MYAYLYFENGGLEWLPDDVRFVPNLILYCRKIVFHMFLKPYLHEQAHACVRRLQGCICRFMLAHVGQGFPLAFIFQK